MDLDCPCPCYHDLCELGMQYWPETNVHSVQLKITRWNSMHRWVRDVSFWPLPTKGFFKICEFGPCRKSPDPLPRTCLEWLAWRKKKGKEKSWRRKRKALCHFLWKKSLFDTICAFEFWSRIVWLSNKKMDTENIKKSWGWDFFYLKTTTEHILKFYRKLWLFLHTFSSIVEKKHCENYKNKYIWSLSY